MTTSGGRRRLAAARPRPAYPAEQAHHGDPRRDPQAWPVDRARIRNHLLRLDREDRMLRFGGYASTAPIRAYCAQLDFSRGLVMGYVAGGAVRGLGQLELIDGGEPRAAELAVSVERPFQNRGVGTALLRRVVIAGRNRLIRRIHMVCLMDNGRAVRMARRLDGTLHFHDGAAEARIEPPWPTPWTWLEELLFEPAVNAIDHARWRTRALPAGNGATSTVRAIEARAGRLLR